MQSQFTQKNNYLNLLLLTENQLIFKKPKIKITSPSIKKNPSMRKSLDFQPKSITSKNIKEKRIILRKIFDSKTLPTKNSSKGNNLQIIGKSESQEPSRCPSVHRKLNSISRPSNKTLKSLGPSPQPSKSNQLIFPFSQKKPRRTIIQVVPLLTKNQETTELDDLEDSMIIKSRYF